MVFAGSSAIEQRLSAYGEPAAKRADITLTRRFTILDHALFHQCCNLGTLAAWEGGVCSGVQFDGRASEPAVSQCVPLEADSNVTMQAVKAQLDKCKSHGFLVGPCEASQTAVWSPSGRCRGLSRSGIERCTFSKRCLQLLSCLCAAFLAMQGSRGCLQWHRR